ncbi:MAG: 50S ribosome-binding GTPase [Acidimicrobiia bacterium]|nr:50S ribosome-binding GTPase [Acidimicrobiia bacterium]MDH3397211.1 50S ribosome-binding GTPase [Acidimicrobiia bacterium]
MRRLSIALAGNPNSGKTTLFNVLTGSRQHVGNWPGKTVEKRSGRFSEGDVEFEVVDLPGTYSLAAVSPEELVARGYLLEETPDVVILVVDASNPERNLYLTVQILELGIPCVVALNMSDTAEARGLRIDHDLLQQRLGIPVIRTVARRRDGIEDLLKAVVAVGAERAA